MRRRVQSSFVIDAQFANEKAEQRFLTAYRSTIEDDKETQEAVTTEIPKIQAVAIVNKTADFLEAQNKKDTAADLHFYLSQEIPRSKSVIEEPPGSWMVGVAATVFSKKVKERVFDQLVADFRQEYFEALHEHAGRSRIFFLFGRHWFGFLGSVILQAAHSVAKVIKTLKGAG